MNRRRALFILGLGVAASFSLRAQTKPRRIGFLYFGSRQSAVATGRYQAYLDGMRALGYAAGKDFVLEERFAEGREDLIRDLVADLVRSKVDVIVASGSQAIHEAKRATATIPIVVAQMGGDPVRGGLAKSLARPGGNVTGLYVSNIELLAKQLELMAMVIPKMSRVAVLQNPSNPVHPSLLEVVRATARKSKRQVIAVQAARPVDVERAFAAMTGERADALLILGDTFFVQQAPQLAELAVKHRLPMVSTTREYADAGGLIAYGENSRDNYRSAADYVDKILKGAKAGDLPFRRSQRPFLVINSKTFKTLGLALPQELEFRADEVIK